MSEMTFQFRTSAVGGFQKKDVLEYIEQSNRTHSEALEALKRSLVQEEKAKDALAEQLTQAEEKVDQEALHKEELTRLSEGYETQVSQLTAQVEDLQQRLATLTQEKTTLSQENAALIERLKVCEVQAQCYETIKERTAGMELEALRRAQVLENDAQTRVDEIWAQLEAHVQLVEQRYQALRTKLSAITAQATTNVDQTRDVLVGISSEFECEDNTIAQILSQLAAKEPVLLPLED